MPSNLVFFLKYITSLKKENVKIFRLKEKSIIFKENLAETRKIAVKIKGFDMLPSKGKLLIAEPFLGDRNFERSVVLLCEHNEQGSFGLVLNQLTNLQLDDVIDGIYGDLPLFLGGPVEQNTLHFIHRLGNEIEGAVDIGNGLFWSGNFEEVKTLINIGKIKENDIRLFIGYSGWGKDQLEKELSKDSWIVANTDADFIFETPSKEFWRAVLRRMGGEYKVLSHYPTDPRLN